MSASNDSVANSSHNASDKAIDNMEEELKERHTGAAEAPTEITVSRKRKQEKMDTEDSVKRPSFPPISSDKLMVNCLILRIFMSFS